MSSTADFHPHQILCLKHAELLLYAELIQVVQARQMCWVRPLALLALQTPLAGSSLNSPELGPLEAIALYDLRQSADLLCPASLFDQALDTEVIPVLAQLNALKSWSEDNPNDNRASDSEENGSARQHLQEFIRRVWQAHPDVFQST